MNIIGPLYIGDAAGANLNFFLEDGATTAAYTGTDIVAGDIQIAKTFGAFAPVTNAVSTTRRPNYILTLTAAECIGEYITVWIHDFSGTAFKDCVIFLRTAVRLQNLAISSEASSFGADAVVFNGKVGGRGLNIANSGGASTVVVTNGGAGDGVAISGGATSGNGVTITGSATGGIGLAISAVAGNNAGVSIQGSGNEPGLKVTGGSVGGTGIRASGGSSSGAGIIATGTGGNLPGLSIQGQGTAPGILSVGGATGEGAKFQGGATSGAGVVATAQGGNSAGLSTAGFGSQPGILSQGGATGNGVSSLGGATAGAGILAQSVNSGAGLSLQGNSTAPGLLSTGGSNGNGAEFTGGASVATAGAKFTGQLAGAGINAVPGATGVRSTLLDDPYTDITAAPVAGTTTVKQGLGALVARFFNQVTQTQTTQTIFNSANVAKATEPMSDNGVLQTKGKAV